VAPSQQPAIQGTLDYRIIHRCNIYLRERGLQSGRHRGHTVHDVNGMPVWSIAAEGYLPQKRSLLCDKHLLGDGIHLRKSNVGHEWL